MTDHHSALIYSMVLASAADREMTDTELHRIGQIVERLPAFEGFDTDTLAHRAAECAELLNADDGLETVLDAIRDALPEKLRETARSWWRTAGSRRRSSACSKCSPGASPSTGWRRRRSNAARGRGT